MEFSIDGEKIVWGDGRAYVVSDSENGVFTIFIEEKPGYVVFWAIPSTFKVLQDSLDGTKYKFKADMFGTEPRKDKGNLSPAIELSCEYDYHV